MLKYNKNHILTAASILIILLLCIFAIYVYRDSRKEIKFHPVDKNSVTATKTVKSTAVEPPHTNKSDKENSLEHNLIKSLSYQSVFYKSVLAYNKELKENAAKIAADKASAAQSKVSGATSVKTNTTPTQAKQPAENTVPVQPQPQPETPVSATKSPAPAKRYLTINDSIDKVYDILGQPDNIIGDLYFYHGNSLTIQNGVVKGYSMYDSVNFPISIGVKKQNAKKIEIGSTELDVVNYLGTPYTFYTDQWIYPNGYVSFDYNHKVNYISGIS